MVQIHRAAVSCRWLHYLPKIRVHYDLAIRRGRAVPTKDLLDHLHSEQILQYALTMFESSASYVKSRTQDALLRSRSLLHLHCIVTKARLKRYLEVLDDYAMYILTGISLPIKAEVRLGR